MLSTRTLSTIALNYIIIYKYKYDYCVHIKSHGSSFMIFFDNYRGNDNDNYDNFLCLRLMIRIRTRATIITEIRTRTRNPQPQPQPQAQSDGQKLVSIKRYIFDMVKESLVKPDNSCWSHICRCCHAGQGTGPVWCLLGLFGAGCC